MNCKASLIHRMRFEFKLGTVVVGYSELEWEDAPMGVAFGQFLPTPAYSSIQADCVKQGSHGMQVSGLTVQLIGGAPIQCSGGIQLIDVSAVLGEAGIQVHLNGVIEAPYSQIFPQHVEAYRKQFR